MSGCRPIMLEVPGPALATEPGARSAVHKAYGLYRAGHPVACVVVDDPSRAAPEPGASGDVRALLAAFRRAGVPTAEIAADDAGQDWSGRDASSVGVAGAVLSPRACSAFGGHVDRIERRELGPFPFTAGSPSARVALLGLGAVGGGVYELVRDFPGIEVSAVAVRDAAKPRDIDIDPGLITTDPRAAMADCDLVVELIGGTDVARELIESALRRGVSVITANKALIAECGPELHALAERHNASLLYSASVGGSVPVLERVQRGTSTVARGGRGDRVRTIRAILNGTTNYLLDELAEGRGFKEAVADAQRLGFAEADPTRDVTGLDAADKLRVLGQVAAGSRLSEQDIQRDALSADTAGTAVASRARGEALRHVGSLDLTGDHPAASVRLFSVGADDPLFDVPGEQNAAVIEWASGRVETVAGFGAGRYPTAESVMADILQAAEAVRTSRQ